MVNVGKYTSPMDPMGKVSYQCNRLVTLAQKLTCTLLENGKLEDAIPFEMVNFKGILLMDEILHHLGWLKPYK